MENLDQTILSQYDNDPVTDALVASFGQAINPSYLFEQFYNLIFNILTAQGYGLDVWGRIVGVGRVVSLISATGEFLGFKGPSGASGTTFNFGIFYSGQPASVTTNFTLTDQAYRQLIFAKAAANITDGAIPNLNQILLNLFPGRGNCYVQDNQDMTITYVFTFPLMPFERAIVENSGVLPTPSGIKALYSIPS